MRMHRIVPVLAAVCVVVAAPKDMATNQRTPVLVELFTSEGCSSCPPADLLIEKLDATQPIPGAQIIVLSEHVDYWNHIGWIDPYSSPVFSRRQEAYVRRLHLDSSYTPQMIVDGAIELVGSDRRRAESAISAESKADKVAIRLSAVPGAARIEADPLPKFAGHGKADVYFVVAQDSGTSDVLRGENQGRRLHHVAIVRRIEMVGNVSSQAAFIKDVPLAGAESKDMRLVAFVQQAGGGRVLGSAMLVSSR